MGAYTYFYDHEAERMSKVEDDKDLNDLLQEVRAKFGPTWFVAVRTHKPRRSWWRKAKPEFKSYEVYHYTGGGIEYQAINLVTEYGSGSVFTIGSRSGVMNYFLGMLTGYDDVMRRVPVSVPLDLTGGLQG